MEEFVNGIVKAAPEVVKNTHFNITLSDIPAAVSVGLVCASGVIVYRIYCWEKLEERKQDVDKTAAKEPVTLDTRRDNLQGMLSAKANESVDIMVPVKSAVS